MNKKTLVKFILLFFALAFQYKAKAQSAVQSNVYFELFGPGGVYSANYEARFGAQPNNLGLRVGVSYTQISSVGSASLFTVPVGLNYLLGKDEKYFEVGAGATYATASLTDINSDNNNNSASGSTVFGTMVFGYRKQPSDGGFLFRAGVSPVFGKGFFYPYWVYIGFGYSFR